MPRHKILQKKCLTPGCTNTFPGTTKGDVGARGLCKGCHGAALRMIQSKKTTWEELEKLELAEPPYPNMVAKALYLARKTSNAWGWVRDEGGDVTGISYCGTEVVFAGSAEATGFFVFSDELDRPEFTGDSPVARLILDTLNGRKSSHAPDREDGSIIGRRPGSPTSDAPSVRPNAGRVDGDP